MELYPAIDLLNGQAVRLYQGDQFVGWRRLEIGPAIASHRFGIHPIEDISVSQSLTCSPAEWLWQVSQQPDLGQKSLLKHLLDPRIDSGIQPVSIG